MADGSMTEKQSQSWDVIVVGLGACGAAALDALAAKGLRCLGLDQFCLPHDQGSTHGDSRIIRAAYFEDPRYVPLVQRAFEAWRILEEESDRSILTITGGLMIGPESGDLVAGSKQSAQQHNIKVSLLGPRQVASRFPAFVLSKTDVALFEPGAGLLHPERGLKALLSRAGQNGAEVQTGVKVKTYTSDCSGVKVEIEGGQTLRAKHLVLATGAWLKNKGDFPLTINRQLVHYFPDEKNNSNLCFSPSRMPIFVWQKKPDLYHYGFPDLGRGVKLATHHGGQETTPDTINREVDAKEFLPLQAFAKQNLPALATDQVKSSVCMYSNTPDGHFLIGRHPNKENILVMGGCSGHGFKFAPILGQLVADLVFNENSDPALALFDPARFEKRKLPNDRK